MLKKYLFIPFALMLAACGREVEIPAGHVGKTIGSAGVSEANLPPGKSRLEQEIDLINAETQVLTQKKLADGYSVAWAMTKYLEFLQTAASNPSTVYLPMASLEQVPAQIAMWSDAMERGRDRAAPKP